MRIDRNDGARLWADYRAGRNERVPISFACDEQVWLKVSGHTFREFYSDPRIHLQAQLEGKRWFSENIPGDTERTHDHWDISVQLWMEENAFYGCEVIYQQDDYAWAKPLPLERRDLLGYLADLDPADQVRTSQSLWMYEALRDIAEGKEYAGKPIRVHPPGRGTHGVFTKAAEIRGLDKICLDMYEAPDFADQLLALVTDKTVARILAYHEATGEKPGFPLEREWGCPDDSLQLLSPQLYERFVLPQHERLYSTMTTGRRSIHLCGRATQHYELLHNRLGISLIDGPGPFADHGYYLELLGPDLAFNAQTDNSVLAQGTPGEIEDMMRRLLTPKAKLPGRFNVLGFVTRDAPLANVALCYELGKRYGIIPDRS